MKKPMMKSTCLSFAAAIVCTSSFAFATPNFPPAIEQTLMLSSAPACALCHTDGDQGGLGTVNTPFGKSIRAYGVVAYDTVALNDALSQMESQNVNSAGACLDDIAELEAGGDPNQTAAAGSCGDGGSAPPPTSDAVDSPSPSSGCGATIAPSHDTGNGIGALALVALFFVARRSRATRRSR